MLTFRFLSASFILYAINGVIGFSSEKWPQQVPNPPLAVLDYGIFQGFINETNNWNLFLGIPFAKPPVGTLRWQKPEPPVNLIDQGIINATVYKSECPQSSDTGISTGLITGPSEDCLYMNIYAPPDAQGLPVLFYIHGGGYGQGNGQLDPTYLESLAPSPFVTVSIQYRLGAFGFLSSDEIARKGVANAGLYDQIDGLEWVQRYITQFGGDPGNVTIGGISAGGGSTLMMSMAYGGSLGSTLFSKVISMSPYVPQQWKYDAYTPTLGYYRFAEKVGCFNESINGLGSSGVFECLVAADTLALQNASQAISSSVHYGTKPYHFETIRNSPFFIISPANKKFEINTGQWGFVPVTDGVLIQEAPSTQLGNGKINGNSVLTGNMVNEGPIFTTPNITTEADFDAWVAGMYPLLSAFDLLRLKRYYPAAPTGCNSFDSALFTSAISTGQQQRADNLVVEQTFACPSYWLAEAFPTAYKYQYSLLPGLHGQDTINYFPETASELGVFPVPGFQEQYAGAWANYIVSGIPDVPSLDGQGPWPRFADGYELVNFNITAGVNGAVSYFDGVVGYGIGPPDMKIDNQSPHITIEQADTWEGGRGFRCDFLKSLGHHIPE